MNSEIVLTRILADTLCRDEGMSRADRFTVVAQCLLFYAVGKVNTLMISSRAVRSSYLVNALSTLVYNVSVSNN